nr:MAG TPA: Protein of unknown function (DUF2674) [Caudoviricetes sp.]
MDLFILNILIILFVGAIMSFVMACKYSSLIDENNKIKKDVEVLVYKIACFEKKLSSFDDNDIYEKCDKTLQEFNEIMFGSPPLKNKVVVVRGIKDYDYSAYRKDIDTLNEYLKDGWSVVNHESNEFVHTYILGKPLAWSKDNEMGDNNDE